MSDQLPLLSETPRLQACKVVSRPEHVQGRDQLEHGQSCRSNLREGELVPSQSREAVARPAGSSRH